MLQLGIVILNYKTYQDVFCCIESIKNTLLGITYKIYIVDNNSPNESVEELRCRYEKDEDIVLIANKENGGFSVGNNIGFKVAVLDGCENILCTNSDVVFYENAIRVMLQTLTAQEEFAVVGPKVYLPNGDIQQCNRGILTPWTFLFSRQGFQLFDIFGVRKKYIYANYDYEKCLYPEGMVSGCCFMIKASVLRKIDYLDEKVFLYYEEDILGAKLRKIGLKVCLNPQAEILHYGGKTTGQKNPLVRYCTFYSGCYYLCAYSEASPLSIKFVMSILRFVFFLYACRHSEYKEYYHKFKMDIKELKKLLKNRKVYGKNIN